MDKPSLSNFCWELNPYLGSDVWIIFANPHTLGKDYPFLKRR
jgi:hypothetical protein